MACLGFALLTTSAAAQTIEPIYSFTNSGFSSPRNPHADLILGGDGNFYGTTENGGSGGFGTVFRVTTSGALTVLANFDSFNTGGDPYGGVMLGPDGNLYGTTYFSGPGGVGTVFRVTTDGVLTRLYSFSRMGWTGSYYTNNDGGYPYAGLALGPDGCLYGATSGGGSNGSGTLFKITTNGVLTTTLFSFSALSGSPPTNTTGARPYARLTLGPDGNFYGTTFLGGTKGDGTVFRVTTDGAFTVLVNFVGTNGVGPQGALTVGPDSSLYGTTVNGGIYGDTGTVFKMTTNGVLTTLVSFDFNTGAAPGAGVTLGPDGNFYGTTSVGSSSGTDSRGTVFRVTTNGVLTTLANFSNTNGSLPEAGVTLGPDGNFYGTAFVGGSDDPNAAGGVIYRLNLGLTLTNRPPSISISRSAGGAVMLNLASETGSTNRLWVTTNLSLPMPQWQVLATIVATNGSFEFTDTNTSANQMRFYRLSTP